ncbi:MAG TPA: T9SS type A sorting domain-containing protein, partial [Chitinophagales bacterium]|nr:T9SS type A sorting domain-containing protein [Chitinophagales bacterium]HRK29422.1 T9SS type A sorting domain-containing protein [Chitinophagales bacterium]
AQTMLLIAYGEEYPATLPDLPAFLDTATLNLLMQEGINFKNNPDKQKAKIGNLYPNPAQNMIYLSYNLPDADMAVFNLYDPTGRLLYSEKLYKTGLMRYSVEHLPMGIYYYQIAINGQPLQYNKFVLVK